METKPFKVQKTARYSEHGNPEKAKYIWVALHGYGQLSKYFVRNFKHLDPEEHYVICPEGLNRFYLDGLSGRVGATWMTKEGRLEDIEDYVSYLDLLYQNNIQSHNRTDVKIILFGFSQGVATAARWLAMGTSTFHCSVLWAGSFPPDLPPMKAQASFEALQTLYCSGDTDEFIDEQKITAVRAQLEALNIKATWMQFEGGHRIPAKALDKAIAFINR